MNENLLASLHQCIRYKNAPRFSKPFQSPVRFVRNQLRQGFGKEAGTIEAIDTFHMKDFTIVSGEIVSEELACYGFMEPELTEAFLRLVSPGDTALDVGMHLGYFTTLFGELVGSKGKVISFEPTPSTREIAMRNTAKYPQVSVYPNAVWSHSTTMGFHDYGISHMAFNSVTSARLDHDVTTVRELEVEAICLDDFRLRLGSKINIIKIDAETAEEEILKGSRQLLRMDQPILTVEVGDEGAEPGRSRKLIEELVSMDYEAWSFSDGAFKRHEIKPTYTYDNLIFSPLCRPLG